MTLTRFAAAFGAVLLLAGCRAAPLRTDLALPIPPAWTTPPPAGGAPAPGDPWWRSFGDPALDAVIAQTLANNPSLAAASANLDAALARVRIEGARERPSVSASLNQSRRKQNFIGFPIPGSEDGVLSTTSTNAGLGLNVSWEVDLWGRLRAATGASRAEADAVAADLLAARLSLAGQAAKAYFAVVEGRNQVALAERTLDTRTRTEQRIQTRYERGLAQALELRLARTQAATVRAALAQRTQAKDAALRSLEALLGRYPDATLDSAAELPPLPAVPAAGVPAELVRRRPDLRAAERRVLAQSHQVRAAQRALYPAFSLTGSTGTASRELGDLLDGDFSVWSLAAGLLQPLFQGGRLRANVDLQRAGLDASAARFLDATLRALAEVESALFAQAAQDELVAALERAAAESRQAEELALDRYLAGLADYLSVLESQRSSFSSESALLEARRRRLERRVDLILALGGDPTAHPATLNPDAPAGVSSR